MTTTSTPFIDRSSAILAHLEETGQLKQLQMIESPMGPRITIRGRGEVDCFCSNNYLGLANHPDVVEAGIEGLRKYGAGTSSVRFICGTFVPHEKLEERIASFLDVEASYTFVSCWNATEAMLPTLCQDGDVIVSDELNHACIIDSMRLTTAICPIIVGKTSTAIEMGNKLLDMGVFAIGFGYPVVPEGTARIRVQISAAHETEHIDRLCRALSQLK